MAESMRALKSEQTEHEGVEIKVIQAARQDPKAFGELYTMYVEHVFRYLYTRTGNVHEAEDITAQTFLAALESFDQIRQDGHFASWLFTIARNKTTDHFPQKKGITSLEDADVAAADANPLNDAIQSEQAADLANLIRALPEEDRELLRVRFLAAMSFPEMAHFLHRNEDAVKKTRLLTCFKELHFSQDDFSLVETISYKYESYWWSNPKPSSW